LENGQVIFDSHVIRLWADRARKMGPQLFPEGFIAERDKAAGTGLIDVALPWLVKTRIRPASLQSNDMIAAYRIKMNRVVDWFEDHFVHLFQRRFDIRHLSIGVELCYLDFRFSTENWRDGRLKLSAWHLEFCQREPVRLIQFLDDPSAS
jgi:hypothetical protein